MRRPVRLLRAILLVVLAGRFFLPAATAQAGVQDGVSVLSATSSGVTFEVGVPWEQLKLEPVTAGDVEYVRVSLAGWAATTQAGAPLLPQIVETLGVPFGVVLSVRVEPGVAHTLALSAPALPVTTQKVEWGPSLAVEGAVALPMPSYTIEEDLAVYAGDDAYPGVLARVASDGVLREQRVAAIGAYPVQYNPATRELTVYESLRVEVLFEGLETIQLQAPSVESDAYENLLRQELLNYETARQWRQSLDGSAEGTRASGASVPWAPPAPGWRVKVRADGFYKLTYAELQGAGLAVDTLVPSTFKLYNAGNEVAIYVEGEGDGKFDTTDYVLFYGQAVASKYTADNVYWLTYGQGSGLRMGSRDGTPVVANTPAYYPARLHMESNVLYLPNTPGTDALERWLWGYVYAPTQSSWTHTFSLAAPYAGTYPAKLTVAMVGYVEDVRNPDHHARVLLNGTQVANVWWDGITWNTVEVPIAQSLLVAGNNTLSVVCPNDTGVGYDLVFIDWAELEFANTFRAEGDVLPFRYEVSGTWKFQVDGFSNNQVAVYDVTNPAAVAQITGISVASSALGYALQFQDAVAAPTAYWALAKTAYRTVQAIEQDTASNLQSTTNGADYIVITHKDFAAQAAQLRNFRASQGLRAITVDIQDVYDEFGYGIVGAPPIHDFLAYAYGQWQAPAPSFVVLLGDGHYDPKNYEGYGRVSYVPPYLAAADPWITETAADNRYVTLIGADTMPDMMLGRLAVNNSAEASAFVNKVVAYEQSPVAGAWQQQVLAVADNADSGGDYVQYTDNLLADCLPASYQAAKVYYGVTHTTVAAARAAILAGINAGKLIVNYVGHAAETQWAEEGLFKATDVAGLVNGGKLPVMLVMTCYDGYYHHSSLPAAGQDATAEVVTRANGKGAVASWSETGLGLTPARDYLERGFFRAMFYDGKRTLGQATNAGKLKLWATGRDFDLLDTYLLFGDPATRLPVGLFGDVNGDCVVDVVDIMLVAGRWNTSTGDPQYDTRYDLNNDGYIDVADIMLVAARWNTHC